MTAATPSSTRDVILDSAFAALTRHGLAKLSLGDVARQAGLSRQTVYRYFHTRDDLIVEALVRELAGFVALVEAAMQPYDDLGEAVETVLRATFQLSASHPLLNRLLDDEPGALLPYLATDASPVLAAAVPAVERMVAARAGHLPIADVRRFADTLVRMMVSHILHRSPEPPEVIAAQLARLLMHGLDSRRDAMATVEG